MKSMETWKDIKGYEGLYQVSNLGNIRSLDKKINDYRGANVRLIKGKLLTPFDNGNGYLVIGLIHNGARKNFYMHRLVATYFVPNPDGKPVINHKDRNKYNNKAENLEWVTQRENVLYSAERMRHPKSVVRTNTGEKYITCRSSNKRYRVNIKRKEYGEFKTLAEAIAKRDEVLKGVM